MWALLKNKVLSVGIVRFTSIGAFVHGSNTVSFAAQSLLATNDPFGFVEIWMVVLQLEMIASRLVRSMKKPSGISMSFPISIFAFRSSTRCISRLILADYKCMIKVIPSFRECKLCSRQVRM